VAFSEPKGRWQLRDGAGSFGEASAIPNPMAAEARAKAELMHRVALAEERLDDMRAWPAMARAVPHTTGVIRAGPAAMASVNRMTKRVPRSRAKEW
jgi:hypothetical protein